jgi:hypothetical protein
VIDAMNGLLSLQGGDQNNAGDVESLFARVLRPLRDRAGAAVLIVDHVTKASEGKDLWATGSERKLSGIDGAGYKFHVVRPFGRGREGLARLVLAKDRPGEIGAPKDVVAEVTISDEGTSVVVTLTETDTATTDGPWRPTILMERISLALEAHAGPMSTKEIEVAVRGKAEHIRTAIAALIEDGYVTTTSGPRGAVLHHQVAAYREADTSPRPSSPPRPHLVPDDVETPATTSSLVPPFKGDEDEVAGRPDLTLLSGDDLVPGNPMETF